MCVITGLLTTLYGRVWVCGVRCSFVLLLYGCVQEAPPKQVPKTLESTRDPDRTVVKPADEEVFRDEAEDEFAKFFSNEQVWNRFFSRAHFQLQAVYAVARARSKLVVEGFTSRMSENARDVVVL